MDVEIFLFLIRIHAIAAATVQLVAGVKIPLTRPFVKNSFFKQRPTDIHQFIFRLYQENGLVFNLNKM